MEPEVWRSWVDIGLVWVWMVGVVEVEQERRSKRNCGFEKINERQCSHFLVNIGRATIVVVVVVVVVVVIRLASCRWYFAPWSRLFPGWPRICSIG
jgi:hypothetical protein